MNGQIKLFVYHTNDDDPKKCSAKKLARFNMVRLRHSLRGIPAHGVLLNPLARQSLSITDLPSATKHGIVAVDCSWKHAEPTFAMLSQHMHSRALPFLIPVNPVNYGKPGKLTTLEALAAALYILGKPDQATQLLKIYKWAPHFLTMNKEPLKDYHNARNSTEVIQKMHQYLKE